MVGAVGGGGGDDDDDDDDDVDATTLKRSAVWYCKPLSLWKSIQRECYGSCKSASTTFRSSLSRE